MTARIEAAHAAILNTVKMYAPVHAAFSAEATRQLDKAIGEYHNAVVDSVLAGAKSVPPPVPATPPPVTFTPPTERQPHAVGTPTAPAPVPTPTPPKVAEHIAKTEVPTPEAVRAKKSKN